MRAELVMIGTELLLGEIIDTNASFLARGLAECGIDLYHKTTVGDNWVRMMQTLSQAVLRSDIVITSGGLGPTVDDLTREAVAALFNLPLEKREEEEKTLMLHFSRAGRTMAENNRKQAFLPKGAKVIANDWGTAPGFIVQAGGKTVISLPGVPKELIGMFTKYVQPFLCEQFGQGKLYSRCLNLVGIGESAVEEKVRHIIERQTNPTVAPYASQGQVRLRITAKANSPSEAKRLLTPIEEEIMDLVGHWVFGFDQDTLESVVGKLLNERRQTIAVAESCTGGLVSNRLTNIPGSSLYFERGIITYSNRAKQELLAVPKEVLEQFGAVSEQCAQAMAEGARVKSGTDWGLGITGIAGPSGGTEEKPLGLVYISVTAEGYTNTEKHIFSGEREDIKLRSSQAALLLLYKALTN